MKKKFLRCQIYRADYDSDMNFYHGKKAVFYPTPNGTYTEQQREEHAPDETPIVFKTKKVWPNYEPYTYAEPDRPGSYMFGGAYIKCSDGRFKEAAGISYPVPLHDRQEDQK